MLNWFKKKKREKEEIEREESDIEKSNKETDPKSEERNSENEKNPEMTFIEQDTFVDELNSNTSNKVVKDQAKQSHSEEDHKTNKYEESDREGETDLTRKKRAVDKAKQLVTAVSQKYIDEKKAKQLLSDEDHMKKKDEEPDRENESDLTRKKKAVDKAKQLVTVVSQKNIDEDKAKQLLSDEDHVSKKNEESDREDESDLTRKEKVLDKAKQLVTAVSQKNIDDDQKRRLVSRDDYKTILDEASKIKDESDQTRKENAVGKVKQLITEISHKSIAESEEISCENHLNISQSYKETPKVTMSKYVDFDYEPVMSKEMIDEEGAKQLMTDIWEDANSKSESEIKKKKSFFDKKKFIPGTNIVEPADSFKKLDNESEDSIPETPKVALSKNVVFDDKPSLSKEMITEQQARQLISEVAGEKAVEDLTIKEAAVSLANKLISSISKKRRAGKDDNFNQEPSEIDDETMSNAFDKARQLISILNQRADGVPVLTEPEEFDEEITETIKSLKIDLEGGTEYEIQDIVNEAGYEKFQKILFFLCGIGWMVASYELSTQTMFGDLVACEWKTLRWQTACLTSVVFIGTFIGALSFGMLADNVGRKRTLGMSSLLMFVIVIMSILSNSLSMLLVFKLLFGFSLGGVVQVFLIGVEYYPVKDRGTLTIYLAFYWSAGSLLLIITTSFVMQTLNNWRVLLIVCSLPVLGLFYAIKWYPESARFYLVSNQYNRAVKQLEQMLDMNKMKIPPGRLRIISQVEERGDILAMLKKKHRLTTLMLWYICFATFFSYYGIILLTPSVVKSGGLGTFAQTHRNSSLFTDVLPCQKYTHTNYMHLFWTTASEIPGLFVFILMIERIKRKRLLSLACLVTAILYFTMLIDTKQSIVLYFILFFSRASSQSSSIISVLIMSEVYPTTMRATSFGSAAAFSVLGGAIVPFVTQALVARHPIYTTCTSGGIILLGAIMAATLPRDATDAPMEDLAASNPPISTSKK